MGSTRIFTSEEISSELLSGVKDLWKNSLFFDFTLEVEDESIQVHKVILAACSGYFRSMFNSSMKETRQKSANLKALRSDSVKALMSYIYTGYLKISSQTLEETLLASQYLQVSSAVDLCAEFIIGDLSWETVFDAQDLAKTYALENVEEEVKNFMLKNFHEMPDDLVESVGKQILDFTDNDALCVNSEYSLFDRLISFRSLLTDDEFYEALSQVRFPLMSKDELEKVSSTGLMTTRLSHLMDEAWEYHKDVMRQPLLQTERTQVRSDRVAMVIADYNSIIGANEDYIYDIRIGDTLMLEHITGACYIRGIVSVDNFLYVCEKKHVANGTNYLGFFRYDPRFNSWQELQPLLDTERRWFSLVACGKQIFAIGGDNTRTMEIYDIETNQWRFGAYINYNNYLSAGITLDDKIFVCGGEQHDVNIDEHVCVDTLSCYDPVNDTWQFKAPMVEARKNHQSVDFEGRMLVFAGSDGEKSISSVEFYCPEVNQWSIIHDALPYEIYGLCSDGWDVYILRQEKRENTEIPEVFKVSFQKFNMETGTTEEETFSFDLEKYEVFTFRPIFMCSTLMLPFELR